MKFCKGFAALLLVTVLMAPSLQAQIDLEVDSVMTSSFPTVQVNVITRFSNVITREYDSTNFQLWEEGFAQGPLHYTCPSPTKSFSLTIVIAVGSTMSAGDIGYAKGVATRLVNRMNGLTDEGSVMVYDGNQLLQQEFTHIKPLLTSRIDAIAGNGGANHMWDGVYAGVSYCANDGVHPSRGVLILSNGKGDGGTKNLNDVIQLAKTAKIPVYCLGVNAVNSDQDMKELSAQTGGTYFSNADQTVQQLIDDLNGTPPYCTLEYTSTNLCRDGEARNLMLRLRKDNDSTDVNDSFPLSADASTNVSVTLKTDTGTVTTGLPSDIALLLQPAVQGQRLYDGSISLQFDTSALKLQAVRTAGYMAEGVTASPAMTATGADITLTGTAQLDGGGTLMMLEFVGGNVTAATVVSVGVGDFQQSRGCLDATLASANINVQPKRASIATAAQPVIFNWDAAGNHYLPDPAAVTVEVTNDGDLPVSNLSATFGGAPEVRLAYNAGSTVAVVPSTLEPGKKGSATFYVQALPQQSEVTAQVDATVQSAEGAQALQKLYLNIKPAESGYRLSCEADQIVINGGNYEPDPAEVRATITSAGTMDSPAGDVTIVLPPELTLNGGNATQSFASMAPGNDQTLVWPIDYPHPMTATDYPIMLIASANGYPADTCHTTLTVPVLTAVNLEMQCGITPAIADTATGYDDLRVSSVVRNTGGATAYGVEASLTLPAGFVLGSGEMNTKTVADSLQPGDSATVMWTFDSFLTLGCGPHPYTVDIDVTTNLGEDAQCSANGELQFPDNLLPEIIQAAPADIDTVLKGDDVQFSVDMFDWEGTVLSYFWYVDGMVESTTGNSFDWNFDTVGDFEIMVEIYDSCSIATDEAVTYTWNVTVVNSTGVADGPAAAGGFAITGNYPNPFNPATVIEYRVAEGQHRVQLDVLDMYGRVVRTLVDAQCAGGTYRQSFSAVDLPSGTYIARLSSGGSVQFHRMMLVK
ncbi:VWA domain-containing protein [bacterium]|nr:VWA domain-containing protein [bacterium]